MSYVRNDNKVLIPLIISSILFLITVIGIMFGMWSIITDDKDFCLDTGMCKEGLEINAEYGKVKINKENCLKYNWSWRDGYCKLD